ncbi:MAG: 5-(carboxyamino)imidazole ribonucleotide mutase [Lachnospiraceae bacterium]|nr:5-(carboxyamino)imidazole ribonucleotide mutase [Lachnospiraceae bacterium]MBQ9342136.1 5-(carboxyamino)imidazole ribonucleotide mutase [Lachnospiraceae bacterium]MCR5345401.1 5-(carboxyamino)imidazole ribonucleotide mutase [Lachnospiraceae bacterium]
MAKVSIIMGSDSDLQVMKKAADVLENFGVSYEMTIISAHREPDLLVEYMRDAEKNGTKVVIAGAGKAAALPGMCAALCNIPVIGIPMKTSDLGGVDSLYSIVQMPTGVPVATVAINGAANAGLLAVKMLAIADSELLAKLKDYADKQADDVMKKDAALQEMGAAAYIDKYLK